MAPAGRVARRNAPDWPWLAAWALAVAVACGSSAGMKPGVADRLRATPEGSITGDFPGTRGGSTPLAIQAIAETEIPAEDFEPAEPCSHPGLGMTAAHRTGPGIREPEVSRRRARPVVLAVERTNLARLCRLLV